LPLDKNFAASFSELAYGANKEPTGERYIISRHYNSEWWKFPLGYWST